ncbi:hypothetical protein L596_015290 [Steinernema carpocapsae]|uniref:C-type lectin domain-containing protein n=1 Tax=Steinernema carpocapsae TaxID=34508 RepID=A0A4U5NFV1_STECR|nr:hypothetical protein L596_015290 [Steinernema carpocapsae]
MKTLIFLAIAALIAFSKGNLCRPDAFPNHNNSKCFQVIRSAVRFDQASEICQNFGGNLTSIVSAADNKIVTSKKDTAEEVLLWIGGRKILGRWVWLDGATSSYENWRWGDSNDERDFCLGISYTGFWRSMKCSEERQFICEFCLASGCPY